MEQLERLEQMQQVARFRCTRAHALVYWDNTVQRILVPRASILRSSGNENGSNASVCGGACTGRSVETSACKTKDCPSIPLAYFCYIYVVKMVCQAKTYSLNSISIYQINE